MKSHHTDSAPAAIGPYSQAISVDGWLYTAGQIALDPTTGEMVEGGFEAQAVQVLANLRQVLASAGCSFADVVKTTVYLRHMGDYLILNEVWADHFGDRPPARAAVAVAELPLHALVELDAWAYVGD